jgi:hypothetical protein
MKNIEINAEEAAILMDWWDFLLSISEDTGTPEETALVERLKAFVTLKDR